MTHALYAPHVQHHSELLTPFDLDARDPTFWSQGLNMISCFIDELEQLD